MIMQIKNGGGQVICSSVCGPLCAVDGPKGVSGEYANEGKLVIEMEDPKCIGTITNNTYQLISEGDEPIRSLLSCDSHRGGGSAVCVGNGQVDQLKMSSKVGALNCMHEQQAVMEGNRPVVRRLTPMECERLQGFPDGWTDIGAWTDSKGKLHKESTDSARYKALGNSIALPFWFYLLRRISAQYERPATLGSLFDGIGGFPLCWERCNGPGTAVWASEIEEFPIAVTKYHFGGE